MDYSRDNQSMSQLNVPKINVPKETTKTEVVTAKAGTVSVKIIAMASLEFLPFLIK